jgi:transposase
MDALYEAGTAQVMTQVSQRAIAEFKISIKVGNYDTTSNSVWGEYAMCNDGPPAEGPRITYGHSKDLRPDLKQFLLECMCVGDGVPLLGKARDGNASDKVLNNEMLTNLSTVLPQYGIDLTRFIYVADSAAVTEENLEKASVSGFISRLPFTYNECNNAVRTAVAAGNWQEIGALAENQESEARKYAVYKAAEGSVCLYGKTWRVIIVHSSAHDKRRTKGLEKQLEKSRIKLEKLVKKMQKSFHCQPDANNAKNEAMALYAPLHQVECDVVKTTKRGRGRPSADGSVPTQTYYELNITITEKKQEVQNLRSEAGCFVLITNLKEKEGVNAMDAKQVLVTYKQQCAVEMNFTFLKDPLIVNDLFLKKPKRIESLGLILLLSLLVWRLMERNMRQYVRENKTTLPGWDGKRTEKPTSFMMSTKITGVQVLKLPDGTRHLLKPLTEVQLEYLHALGVSQDVFTNPQSVCRVENAGFYQKRE